MHKSHRVIRTAVAVPAHAVNRHNAGMLQAPGDLSLAHESAAAARIVGVPGADLLERHFAMQFLVQRDKHLAESAMSVWP